MSWQKTEHDKSFKKVKQHDSDVTLNSRMPFVTYKDNTMMQKRQQNSSGNSETETPTGVPRLFR